MRRDGVNDLILRLTETNIYDARPGPTVRTSFGATAGELSSTIMGRLTRSLNRINELQ